MTTQKSQPSPNSNQSPARSSTASLTFGVIAFSNFLLAWFFILSMVLAIVSPVPGLVAIGSAVGGIVFGIFSLTRPVISRTHKTSAIIGIVISVLTIILTIWSLVSILQGSLSN